MILYLVYLASYISFEMLCDHKKSLFTTTWHFTFNLCKVVGESLYMEIFSLGASPPPWLVISESDVVETCMDIKQFYDFLNQIQAGKKFLNLYSKDKNGRLKNYLYFFSSKKVFNFHYWQHTLIWKFEAQGLFVDIRMFLLLLISLSSLLH